MQAHCPYTVRRISLRLILLMNLGMIKQYSYGMGEDALFQNNGEGSHVENNKRVFKMLEDENLSYF